MSEQGTLKIRSGRHAERRFVRQQVAIRGQPLYGQGCWQSVAGLVGCGTGFPLWLRKVERRVAVAETVVKWAPTWSATGRAAGQEVGRLGVSIAALNVVQSVSGFAGRGRLFPKAACGLRDTERHALACPFPKAQRVGKGGWFSRRFAVKWRRGLLAWVLAVPKHRGVPANLPACVCLGGGLRPTVRAADTASPWGNVGGFRAKTRRQQWARSAPPCR